MKSGAVAGLKFYMIFALNVAACLWHASKATRYNKPIVRLLRRAKGTRLLFVGNIDSDMPMGFATRS